MGPTCDLSDIHGHTESAIKCSISLCYIKNLKLTGFIVLRCISLNVLFGRILVIQKWPANFRNFEHPVFTQLISLFEMPTISYDRAHHAHICIFIHILMQFKFLYTFMQIGLCINMHICLFVHKTDE